MLVVSAHHPGEQPGSDDVVGLRGHVHREGQRPQFGIALPAARQLRGERRGGPGVHHVGVAGETSGHAALLWREPWRAFAGRVDRQVALGRHDRTRVVGLTVGIEVVPDREGHAEEALAADQPVAVQAVDPVGVAVPHVVGHPGELLATGQQCGLQVVVAPAVSDVPLTSGDDLQRLVTLLVEVRHPLGRLRLTLQITGRAQQRDHRFAGAVGGLAGEFGVGLRVDQPLGGLAVQASVPADHGAGGQPQLTPPLHVGEVPEGAAHRDAGALVGLGGRMGQHRDLDAEHRRGDRGAEQLLVALVVRMRDQRAHRGDQLRTRGLDVDGLAAAAAESHPVVVPGIVAGFELGLGDRSLEGDVPQRRSFREVRLAAGEVAQERALRHRPRFVGDGRVQRLPVDAQAERAPQIFEGHLVDGGQFVAEVHEVAAADRHLAFRVRLLRRGEVRVVRQGRIAAHPVVVLHATLGGQAVVIPTHGVEHTFAAHALVARDQVGVGVAEHVSHVQRSRNRGRRGVDAEHLVARLRAHERVGVLFAPPGRPLRLQPL